MLPPVSCVPTAGAGTEAGGSLPACGQPERHRQAGREGEKGDRAADSDLRSNFSHALADGKLG